MFTACTKENTTVQSSSSSNESSAQVISSDASELAGTQAVRIGSQVWKIKDLTDSHYRNGDLIPEVEDPKAWSKLTTGAWCWYENDHHKRKLFNNYAIGDP